VVRILLVAVPPLIGDIVTRILPDGVQVESITRCGALKALTMTTSGSPIDIVLMGPSDDADQLAAELVATGRALKAIAFSADGRSARIHRAGCAVTILADFSPQDLRVECCPTNMSRPSAASWKI
jgi:hypothetical protein